MSNEHLYQYYELVEAAITELGVNPEDSRLEDEGRWQLQKGEISVIIEVWEMERDGALAPYIMVFSPILEISPNAGAEFFRHALELSHASLGVGYTIFNGNLLLRASRELTGIDKNEILMSILRVGNTAEANYPELLELHERSDN